MIFCGKKQNLQAEQPFPHRGTEVQRPEQIAINGDWNKK